MASLSERRQAVLERHRLLESVRGSGWHQYDSGSPHSQGLMPLSERPLAFIGDMDVILVDGCAQKAIAALKAYLEQHPGEAGEAEEVQLVRARAAAAMAVQQDGTDRLTVNRLAWNDTLYALDAMGVLVCAVGLGDE